MRLLHVQQPLETLLDVDGQIVERDLLIASLGRLGQHRLDLAADPGDPDRDVGVEPPGGRMSPGQDVSGPVRHLNHGSRAGLGPRVSDRE